MFIRSNFAERRKYNRFKVAEGAFAKFHKPRLFKLIKPRIVKSAPIIDISLEGLAFQYTDRTMWSPNFNELSISKAAVDVKIDNVPFKTISDFLASRFSDSTLIRRCGVKFGKLTPSEKLKEVADKYNTLFAPSTTPENHVQFILLLWFYEIMEMP